MGIKRKKGKARRTTDDTDGTYQEKVWAVDGGVLLCVIAAVYLVAHQRKLATGSLQRIRFPGETIVGNLDGGLHLHAGIMAGEAKQFCRIVGVHRIAAGLPHHFEIKK